MKKQYTFVVVLFFAGLINAQNNTQFSKLTLASPPSNDESTNAILITNGNNITEFPQTATTVGATSSVVSATPCELGTHKDVWYKAIIPPSGNLTIETSQDSGSSINDTVFSIFTGTPAVLNYMNCNDDGPVPNFSKLILSGRPTGEEIYILVWGFGGGEDTFRISAFDVSIPLSISNFNSSKLNFYPNPVYDTFVLSDLNLNSKIEIYNLLGQKVFSNSSSKQTELIDLSSLSASTYILQVTSDGIQIQSKIIKE